MLNSKLLHLRTSANLTQEELADKTGLSVDYIKLWENGYLLPTIDILPKLITAFGCSYSDIFDEIVQNGDSILQNSTPPSEDIIINALLDQKLLVVASDECEKYYVDQNGDKYESTPLLVKLYALLKTDGEISVTKLQRLFKLGFSRACRIVDALESFGVIQKTPDSYLRRVNSERIGLLAPFII